MGSKSRVSRRKKNFNRISNLKRKTTDNITSTANASEDNNITTENPMQSPAITVVDVQSILCPKFDNSMSSPVTPSSPTSEDVLQHPLFIVKSEIEDSSSSTYNEQSNEFIPKDVGSMETVLLKIEPNLNENVIQDEHTSISFEQFQCRLCLTEETSNWIEIFTSKPYPYSNVDEITPSNIVDIVEQLTTIKISMDDQLPHKLCLKCFQSLRFVYKFRETSLRSQELLTTEAQMNALTTKSSPEQTEERKKVLTYRIQWKHNKRVVKPVYLQPIPKPEPHPKKRITYEEAYYVDKDEENFDGAQCEICGEMFDKYKQFQYHLNRHHDVRPFACTEPYCDKRFYTPHNRKDHILNSHSIDRKFKCDICGKKYNKMDQLTCHRTIHFPPTIPCKICGKLLRSQQSVRKHRVSHAERLYRCDDCGKSFQNSYTLRVHRRIHTNEKPFICSKCGEAFAHKCSLKTHEEKKHPES